MDLEDGAGAVSESLTGITSRLTPTGAFRFGVETTLRFDDLEAAFFFAIACRQKSTGRIARSRVSTLNPEQKERRDAAMAATPYALFTFMI
jgi:hypothetical protein